jgi:3-oxosteroid 1-dehydrogenase
MDPERFTTTVKRFNEFATSGVDEDFGRGASAYHRFWGDPTNRPNPCLGTLEAPPFFAVRVVPLDVGTCGGVVTNESAQVLRLDGSYIPGLYAVGNCAAPVVGRSYPGAGASIGAALVFGFVAARHATASDFKKPVATRRDPKETLSDFTPA